MNKHLADILFRFVTVRYFKDSMFSEATLTELVLLLRGDGTKSLALIGV